MDLSNFSPSVIAELLSSEEGKNGANTTITKKWYYSVDDTETVVNCKDELEKSSQPLGYFFDSATFGVLGILEEAGSVPSDFREASARKMIELTPSDLVFKKGSSPETSMFGLKVTDGKYRRVKPSDIWDFAKMLGALMNA